MRQLVVTRPPVNVGEDRGLHASLPLLKELDPGMGDREERKGHEHSEGRETVI